MLQEINEKLSDVETIFIFLFSHSLSILKTVSVEGKLWSPAAAESSIALFWRRAPRHWRSDFSVIQRITELRNYLLYNSNQMPDKSQVLESQTKSKTDRLSRNRFAELSLNWIRRRSIKEDLWDWKRKPFYFYYNLNYEKFSTSKD